MDASINRVTINTAQTPGKNATALSDVPDRSIRKDIEAALSLWDNPTSQSESFDEFFALLGKD